jgi:signal transduction histidine kinase
MPRSNIGAEHYLRLVAVMFGGVAVMFGFILLRDIHPGVSVEWSIGTQALALTLGSIGGLLIGVQESASVISHDLRNPLNVAQGHIELARREVENEHLSTVADAHDRMTRLIEDLLTLAQEGETIDETEPADL